MGYALRHVTDLTLTFKEYLRVLKTRRATSYSGNLQA